MARIKKGELTLAEIKNLVRQHNKLSTIVISKKSRAQLIEEVEGLGYRIDHDKKQIKKVRIPKKNRVLKVSDKGDTSTQKKKKVKQKKKEMLKKGGSAPVYVADRGEDEL